MLRAGPHRGRSDRRRRPKALLLRLDPAVVKRLKLLAVERDTTVQQLGEEAIDRLLSATRIEERVARGQPVLFPHRQVLEQDDR